MNIYVDAYLAKNLGDDLFIHILAAHFPDTAFFVNYYGAEYRNVFANNRNVKFPYYALAFKLFNRLGIYDYINDVKRISRTYDAMIFLGGSIFREEEYWKDLYKLRMSLVEAFQQRGKPVYVLGANFGPVYSKEFYQSYYYFFQKCTDVCFREKYSANLFGKLSCVRYESDIIFQMDIKNRIKKKKRQIAFSLIEPNHKLGLERCRNNYFNRIKEALLYYLQKKYSCILLSFCEKEGDLNICQEIMSELTDEDKKNVHLLNYDGDIEEILNVIVESQLLIASRFHANILGILLNTKILPLVYSNKTVNVLRDISFKGEILSIENIGNIIDSMELAMKFEYQVEHLESIKESSLRQFAVLEKFIDAEKESTFCN